MLKYINCSLGKQCIQLQCQKLITETLILPGSDDDNSNLIEWIDNGQQYTPSHNLPPTSISPVIISSSHAHLKTLKNFQNLNPFCIQPMKWGLAPSWNPKKCLTNCRGETIMTTPTFSRLMKEGKRCIILADGYFEWQKELKLPYYFYFVENYEKMSAMKKEQSSDSVKNYDSVSEHTADKKGSMDMKETESVKLLTMAGLFDSYKCSKTNEIVYAYMVITVAAHEDYQFIHDRMPAILDGDEVIKWLDCEKYPAEQAASLLRPTNKILCHRVSMCVNKAAESSVKCVLAIDPNAIKEESPKKKMTPLKNVAESPKIKKQSRTPSKGTSKMKTPKDEKAASQPVKRNILQSWLETANDKKKPKIELEETSKANEIN